MCWASGTLIAVRYVWQMGFFDREHSVAGPGFTRWLVPPAALAVHLSIGQVYAFSVFKLPLTKAIGITLPRLTTGRSRSWPGFSVSPSFFLAPRPRFLGAGWSGSVRARRWRWPRSALAAALSFPPFGVWWHQLWLIYLGYGVLGGCGLGLGYISPVSTLVKWFPDRPGMATGMAIMGFGGGAFIGSNLSLLLMNTFKSATSTGVGKSFLALG